MRGLVPGRQRRARTGLEPFMPRRTDWAVQSPPAMIAISLTLREGEGCSSGDQHGIQPGSEADATGVAVLGEG